MRRAAVATLWALAGLSAGPLAHAVEQEQDSPPGAGTGLQAAVRVGYSRPMGQFQGLAVLELANLFDWQLPILADVGVKLGEYVFLGGFLGYAAGGAGATFDGICEVSDCSVSSFRFGLQIHVALRPSARLNPWIGYGIGYDFSALHVDDPRGAVSLGVRGIEFAHLMLGADYRLAKSFGFGPYLDYAFGVYTDRTVETPAYSRDDTLHDADVHSWFTAGVRMVLFP